jgi:hypothetical protein
LPDLSGCLGTHAVSAGAVQVDEAAGEEAAGGVDVLTDVGGQQRLQVEEEGRVGEARPVSGGVLVDAARELHRDAGDGVTVEGSALQVGEGAKLRVEEADGERREEAGDGRHRTVVGRLEGGGDGCGDGEEEQRGHSQLPHIHGVREGIVRRLRCSLLAYSSLLP